jgi:hypothetical protein
MANAGWVRPLAMFTEQVTVDGRTLPRFRPLEASFDFA